jgi:hypothetical protein
MNGRANVRDSTVNELRSYVRSLEHDREERTAAWERERAEREAAVQALRVYAGSLERDRETRAIAVERERAELVAGFERERDELVAAFEHERAERDATLEQVLAYARSFERHREDLTREHAAGIDQIRAYALGLERTLLEIAANRAPAPMQPSTNGQANDSSPPVGRT